MTEATTTAPAMLPATHMIGGRVRNRAGDDLGRIENIVLDPGRGRIAYAVLSFGGFLGVGNKLFAIPWNALHLAAEGEEFVLDIERERLEAAPGFDKSRWPDFSDRPWAEEVFGFYRVTPYWQASAAAGRRPRLPGAVQLRRVGA